MVARTVGQQLTPAGLAAVCRSKARCRPPVGRSERVITPVTDAVSVADQSPNHQRTGTALVRSVGHDDAGRGRSAKSQAIAHTAPLGGQSRASVAWRLVANGVCLPVHAAGCNASTNRNYRSLIGLRGSQADGQGAAFNRLMAPTPMTSPARPPWRATPTRVALVVTLTGGERGEISTRRWTCRTHGRTEIRRDEMIKAASSQPSTPGWASSTPGYQVIYRHRCPMTASRGC